MTQDILVNEMAKRIPRMFAPIGYNLVHWAANMFVDPTRGVVFRVELSEADRNAISASIGAGKSPDWDTIFKSAELVVDPTMTNRYLSGLLLAQSGEAGGGSSSYSVQYTPIKGLSEAEIAAQKAATYLQLASQEEQRRQQAFQTLQQLLPFAVPPTLEFFPGFEPTGPMAFVHSLLGLPAYQGYRIRHTPVDLGMLFAPSPFLTDVLTSLAGITPERSIPPITTVLTGQSGSQSYGGGGGGGLTANELLGLMMQSAVPLGEEE